MKTHPDRWLKNIPTVLLDEFITFYNANKPVRIECEYYWVLIQAYRFLREVKEGEIIMDELIHFAAQKNIVENFNSVQQPHVETA